MPFTFAHPAAVLPFARRKPLPYVHLPAMVLGSMAPDFEYFLRGRPVAEIGHSFAGFFFYNLPLVMLVYVIYQLMVRPVLLLHLPFARQPFTVQSVSQQLAAVTGSPSHWTFSRTIVRLSIFCASALFGMVTHVVWDACTHGNGTVVAAWPLLARSVTVFGFPVPIYKFLQHGSTLFGLTAIGLVLYRRSRCAPPAYAAVNTVVSTRQKEHFWLWIGTFAIFVLLFWYMAVPVPAAQVGVLVVRIIDAVLLSVLVVSCWKRLLHHKDWSK